MAAYSAERTFNNLLEEATVHAHVFMNGTDEAEAVHQMRVLMRKMKTLVWIASELSPETDVKQLKRWVEGWMASLAAVRDKDITLSLLEGLDPGLEARLEEERSLAAERLREAITIGFDTCGSFCAPAEVREAVAAIDKAIGDNWSSLATQHYNDMVRAYRRKGRLLDMEDGRALHQYRLEGKKIKNTVDIFGPVLAMPKKRTRRRLSAFLRLLGQGNDILMVRNLVAVAMPELQDKEKAMARISAWEAEIDLKKQEAKQVLELVEKEIARAIKKAEKKGL